MENKKKGGLEPWSQKKQTVEVIVSLNRWLQKLVSHSFKVFETDHARNAQ